MEEKKRIAPIKLKFKDGNEYTLEFSRESVVEAEDGGFSRFDYTDKIMKRTRELFYYSFKMHHPDITMEETDKILFEDLGGMMDGMMDRLTDLFNNPYNTLVNEDNKPKNPNLTIQM